jgi:hypothetical protein
LRTEEQKYIAFDLHDAHPQEAVPLPDVGLLPIATSANLPLSAQDRTFVAQHISAEQTRLLYRFSLVGYLAELLVTFLLGAILWNDLNDFSKYAGLFAWFGATFIVMLARYGLYKIFIRRWPPSQCGKSALWH